jgi:hypothetical protein
MPNTLTPAELEKLEQRTTFLALPDLQEAMICTQDEWNKLLAMARRGMGMRQDQHDRKSTPEEEYNAFWKEIVEDGAGNINKEQLMKELYDFSFMIREVPKVYMAISGNNLSYPTYHAETVIAQFEDFLNEERTQAVKDAIEDGEVVSSEKVDTLYDAIAHGDEGHRAWLKEAIEKHFEPAPTETSVGGDYAYRE